MRVTLERSNLLKSLNHVHRVVERRNTIPILSNVLLKAEGATLDMKATDLDLEITEATPAMIEQAGATTVPAHLLYDIVRKLGDGSEVLLATNPDGASMTVASGRSKFTLQCLPESDFSGSHRRRPSPTTFRLPANPAQDADRPYPVRDLDGGDALLSQRHLHALDRERKGALKLRASPTDGHRLARAGRRRGRPGPRACPASSFRRKTVGEIAEAGRQS